MVVAVTETHALFVDTAPLAWPERPSMDWLLTRSRHGESLFGYLEPDPTHWRFAGCLLALVREAWGEPLAYIQPHNGRWAVWSGSTTVGGIQPWGRLLGVGDTEDEALAAALLAAPIRDGQIMEVLRSITPRPGPERLLAEDVMHALTAAGMSPSSEAPLATGRADIMVGRVAIELKVQGTARAVLDQLTRYAEDETVTSVILVTTSARHRMPISLAGKPLHVVHLPRL
jgi:hypothetical protein